MKFRLFTVFVAVTLVAAWLATVVTESQFSSAVQKWIWHWIFAICCFSALYREGAKRAFWLGAVFTFLLWSIPSTWILADYNPDLPTLSTEVARALGGGGDPRLYMAVTNTFSLVSALGLSAITGCISVIIYKRAKGL